MANPRLEPEDIIDMFKEEKQRIINRGDQCKALLSHVTSLQGRIHAFKNLYQNVSARTTQLHSECSNIIHERNDLKLSFDKISTYLSRQEELRSIYKRAPEIKNEILCILNSVCQSKGQQQVVFLDEYFIECRRIKELTGQLESCLTGLNCDELALHLEEIYTVYFEIREQLMKPIFTRNIKDQVSKSHRNNCHLLQQTCTSLVRTLRDEIQLFNQIFPTSANTKATNTTEQPVKSQALNNFLSILCRIFYEHLRPIVLHVNHLETLTELHKLVVETLGSEVAGESYQSTMSQLAEDIRERMVFRTDVFIQESVLDYIPSGGDLAYPEKLEIISGGELKDYQSMWYPTVQRTVLALFYLNCVFDPVTFKDLAQEVTLACFKSLDKAQKLIDERHGGTKIEATLFLSKHLAIIRDQLLSYGIERIQYLTMSKTDHNVSKLVEVDTSNLEQMLLLFQDKGFDGVCSESLWSKLNETVVSVLHH